MSPDRPVVRIVDPRAVRVALGPAMGELDVAPIVLSPPAVPLVAAPPVAGTGVLGGVAETPALMMPPGDTADVVLVDDGPATLRFWRVDERHAVLIEGPGDGAARHPVIMLPLEPTAGPAIGLARREVVVDGWRIEVEIESERRASLRDRARRGREATAHDGPTEVRAIIPGRVVAVSIVPGDSVVAGQQLLVVEAMKMQNELRAPRDGVIASVAVGPGRTIEVGDLLLVLE